MRNLALGIVNAISTKGMLNATSTGEDAREIMKSKDYTKEELITMWGKRQGLVNYVDYYGDNEFTFVLLNKENEKRASTFCRESICSYVHLDIKANKCSWKIGISLFNNIPERTTDSKLHSVNRILAVSKYLRGIEEELGFRGHSLECYDNNGYSSRSKQDIWVFNLDPVWFTAPPMISYLLFEIKQHLRMLLGRPVIHGEDVTMMRNLLSKGKPSEIFGRSRQRNWGIRKISYLRIKPNERFCSEFGMYRLCMAVKGKQKLLLDGKFPNNKILEKLYPDEQ